MMHQIKKVEYIGEYKLKLFFKNGKVKIFDMEDRLRTAKNMFLPLKDIEFFKRVKCVEGAIVWPNGVDLCPDALYKIGRDFGISSGKRIRKKSTPSIKTRRGAKSKA
jgi:hypothetical protein